LQGSGSVKGVFSTLKDKLQNLDGTAGLIKSSRDSITTTLTGVASQIAAAQARLDLRRKQLQQQFAAADEAISKLNAMTGQLSQLGSSKLF
jgi:flagellar capping protein FliD